jgi:hypothetical protein
MINNQFSMLKAQGREAAKGGNRRTVEQGISNDEVV